MNDWFCECSCQLDFKCFKMRSINELTLFLISFSNVNNWFNKLKIVVDLKALKIEFTVVHSVIVELSHIMIIVKVNRIRTIHDDSDENVKLSKIKSCDWSKQHDKSSKKSILMFILTTWQSWHKIFDVVNEQHKYAFKQEEKRVIQTEIIHHFQCNFVIVNELHMIKNIKKSMWRILKKMRTNRSQYHFWLMIMSETMINSNSLNILISMNILKNLSWKRSDHQYHHFRSVELKIMIRIIIKCMNTKSNFKTQIKLT